MKNQKKLVTNMVFLFKTQRFNFQFFKYDISIFHNRFAQKVLTPIIISLVAGDLTAGDFFPDRPTAVFLWKTDDLCDHINS